MALISVATQTSDGTFTYTDMNQIIDALKSAGYDIKPLTVTVDPSILASAVAPAVALGDGDTGFYESADDTLNISIAGVNEVQISSQVIEAINSDGFRIYHSRGTSSTSPIYTFANDSDTGIASAAADQLSLIAGGVEGIRVTEDGSAITAIDLNGPVNTDGNVYAYSDTLGLSWVFDAATDGGIAIGPGLQDGRFYVEGSQSAGFILYDSGGVANERTFSVQQNGGSTKFYLYNDSGTLNTSFMEFDHATPLTSIGTNVDIAGDVFLENNKGLIIKTSGGSNTDLFKLSATNQVQIGSTALTTNAIRMLQAVVFYQEIDNGNSGTADTVAWNAGNMQKSTLTDNVTFTFTAPENVGRFQLKLIQDATGGRTVTWPATVKWAGGTAPTISTAANAVDIATFYYDGTSYYGDIIQDMS